VGVEPTIRPVKGRNAGFEGREGHRTNFASGKSIAVEGREGKLRAVFHVSGRDLKTKDAGKSAYATGALGAGGFQRGVFGAEKSRDEAVERGSSADFIVDVRGGRTDFSVGGKFTSEAFA